MNKRSLKLTAKWQTLHLKAWYLDQLLLVKEHSISLWQLIVAVLRLAVSPVLVLFVVLSSVRLYRAINSADPESVDRIIESSKKQNLFHKSG